MPYINIRITDENVSNEQKQALIRGATQLMVDVLNKPPQVTFVVIDEVPTDNWGIGFDQVTEIRKAQSQQ
ncbi:tautomerase family protein [Thalassolituus alkanivorans]|mgnify:CR=1 FL=1|uniref:tautomerase family protein n=1 Tax=Thalassolituus alkanivorans TaxID=2881055 RepID=UPI001E46057D|nr:4-oxalocrotonate tautomerase family protein [Thalassolituus alkanivorans]MCB2385886.1 4-oxalocrotonate tautomerase family protein [Thalassolituus alkanivorans]MCB2421736.1 4-oxalocrotonate tautomerase family protein [Thalassolituus alkanivorans]